MGVQIDESSALATWQRLKMDDMPKAPPPITTTYSNSNGSASGQKGDTRVLLSKTAVGQIYDQEHRRQPESLGLESTSLKEYTDIPLSSGQDDISRTEDQDTCKRCLDLNLPSLLRAFIEQPQQTRQEYPSPWFGREFATAEVGFWYWRTETSKCKICSMLCDSRMQTDRSLIQREEIYALSCADYDVMTGQPTYSVTEQAVCLVLRPAGFLEGDCIDRSKTGRYVEPEGCVVLVPRAAEPAVFMPLAIPPRFDPGIAKAWTRNCLKKHRLFCASEPLPVHGFQVINCTTLLIEDCDAGTPYVALSYVWGATGSACDVVRDEEGKKKLPCELPAVIQDSIEVVKALGYEYLWVDKFCIDQDSPDLKHDQIRQMDAVYRNAELTIISAAGFSERHGLPGVGNRSREHQPVVRFNDCTAMWFPRDPHQSILRSHWSTRGWTFQEALLSRRRLVFLNEQMYFECDTSNCFESINCSPDALHGKSPKKSYHWLRGGVFGRSRGRGNGTLSRKARSWNDVFCFYLSSVEDYTARDLRFADDSLNAFQGVLRMLSTQSLPLGDIWGLCYAQSQQSAEEYPGYSRLWTKEYSFALSLTWMHVRNSAPRRRAAFPSWTWAGWEGQVEYFVLGRGGQNFEMHLKELFFKTANGQTIDIDDIGLNTSRPRTLCITAVSLVLSSDAHDPKSNPAFSWRIRGFRAKLSWSAGVDSRDAFLETYTDTERWCVVWLGSCELSTLLLVLESSGPGLTWVRVGTFTLGAPSYKLRNCLGRYCVDTFDVV